MALGVLPLKLSLDHGPKCRIFNRKVLSWSESTQLYRLNGYLEYNVAWVRSMALVEFERSYHGQHFCEPLAVTAGSLILCVSSQSFLPNRLTDERD